MQLIWFFIENSHANNRILVTELCHEYIFLFHTQSEIYNSVEVNSTVKTYLIGLPLISDKIAISPPKYS